MSKKICLLVTSLSSGGAEKVAANMSFALSRKGYDVAIFSMQNEIDYPYKGTLYNLGLDKKRYGYVRAFLKLRQFFKKNSFDYIIDHRLRDRYIKEVVFSKFVFNACNVIYCIHSYNLSYYFSFLKFPSLATYPHVKNKNFVVVSNEIGKQLKTKLNIKSKTIYNFLSLETLNLLQKGKKSQNNYIIGVGRLTKTKQFDKLIRSYKNSNLPEKNIKLKILGNGEEKERLIELISILELDNYVTLLPFTEEPFLFIKNAKALVLTSKVEGFPMVIIEALNLKTPVISFDCKSGPNEIIRHRTNGLLVDNQDEHKLTLALNDLLNDELYNSLKSNVSLGLESFYEDTIIQEWKNLLLNHI